MYPFKFGFLFILFFSATSFLQAAEIETNTAKSAPFEIHLSDTSAFEFKKLSARSSRLPIEKVDVVEDTLLPPCDVLFFKSGKLEYCKIIESGPETITYKMCDYQDGPNIIVRKSDLHKIRYANGREEVVTVASQPKVNAYVKARKDPLATLSFIFGLTSAGLVLLLGIAFLPLLLAGIILGIISLAKISRRRGELRGKGSAWIGIILCGLIIVLLLAL